MPHLVSFLPSLLASEKTLRAVAAKIPASAAADNVLRLIERVQGKSHALPQPARVDSPHRLVARRHKPPRVPAPVRPLRIPVAIPEPPAKPDDPIGQLLAEASSARALSLELIRQAASDWVRYRDSSHKIRRGWAEEAYLWLFEEDQYPECAELRKAEGRELTSFAAICHELDLDLELVRRRIREIPAQALKASHARKLSRPSTPKESDAVVVVEVHTALDPLFGGDAGPASL